MMPLTNRLNDRVRIVVVDDNRGMRETVVKLLEGDFDIVGQAADGASLVELEKELKPSIGIMDISMPKLNGMQAASAIRARGSEMKIVFLTVHEDPDFVKAAFESGAVGYVVKRHMARELRTALDKVIGGGTFVSPLCSDVD